MAQWIAHLTSNQGVVGSSPIVVKILTFSSCIGLRDSYFQRMRDRRLDESVSFCDSKYILLGHVAYTRQI